MKVIKRDGRIVDFDRKYISNAIKKAMNETELGIDSKLACRIATDIEKEYIDKENISIEEIQDIIESKLMQSNRKDVAKRYIIYRQERTKLRENPYWEMTDIQRAIWENKYRYNNETFKEFIDRVSGNDDEIKKLIIQKKFIPAGRILAGRGTYKDGKKVTLSNCFVLPQPKDNLESIFDTAKNMARTYSWGGGVGIDISQLRPKHSKVNNAAKSTSGAVSFMDLYSLTTGLICQEGRRGALMISLDCSSPDIIEFINCKTDLNKITKANISVRISDEFMKCVENDSMWQLYFKVDDTEEEITKSVKARDIYKLICKNNWNYAEPGALFWSRIEKWHLLSEDNNFKYDGVNPCAEEPLPPGGSCNLCSINLSEFVDFPFTENSSFNFDKFRYTVKKAVNYMNDILDEAIENNLYPLEIQKQMVSDYRQIGIGVMGIADMLIKLGITYGNDKSLELCDKIGFNMINAALQQSSILAKEKGTYPKYNGESILNSPFLKYNADNETLDLIKKYGLFNSQLLTIAPTGSISTMFGVSGGIEPIYEYSFIRKTESLHDEETYYKIFTPIVKEYMDKNNLKDDNELPDYFVNAMRLNYLDRINMQSVWQNHIDASISSTVNLPFATPINIVEDLYMYAWEKGLKGITIYRDNCKRTGILINENEDTTYEKASGICQDCGGNNLIKVGGCTLCTDCGWSPCSV